MQISIINVSPPEQKMSKAGKPYTAISVMYTNEQGQRSTQNILDRTLMSSFQKFVSGDQVDVVTDGAQPYPKWLVANKTGSGAPIASATVASKPVGSTYATSEERAQTQKYIVRQSSITAAINLLAIGAKAPPTQEEVLRTARNFEEHVLYNPIIEPIDSITDDIPF